MWHRLQITIYYQFQCELDFVWIHQDKLGHLILYSSHRLDILHLQARH